MKAKVAQLRLSEQVAVQPELMLILQSQLGSEKSQEILENAIVEVANKMGQVERALMLGDMELIGKTAKMLDALACDLGFLEMSRVASDLQACAANDDKVSLHAVAERMLRLGDASLTALIEGAELPG